MKKWSVLVLLILCQNGISEENSSKPVDINFSMALDEFKKSMSAFINNKDEKKEEEIGLRVFKDIFCLQGFQEKADPKMLQEASGGLENDPVIKEKMADLMKKEAFQLKVASFAMNSKDNPLKNCSFILNESTPDMLAKKKEKEEILKSYNEIINLKKTIHPVFVKLISDLEKKKKMLSKPRYEPIELRDDIYEKNFKKVYEFQSQFVESQLLKKMAMFSSNCIENIKKNFETECGGKPQFAQIKGLVTKYLLCADDHQGKIEKICDYKQTFIQ
ncbi:MAG: hypothetical protein WC635_12260 [Bacteriovorax sp.]|jgi:hypothetical protein